MTTTQQLAGRVTANRDRLANRIRQLVELESPSGHAPAINHAADQVAHWAAEAGGDTVRYPQEAFGDVVEIHFPGRDTGQKPLLLLGHLDTVWPLGTLRSMPWREAADEQGRPRFWGPGVLDMKAGVVMALEAIAAAAPLRRPVILLLNPDEELGSPVSRPHTERVARQCHAVFVLEPAQGMPGSPENAAYKTARKGVGEYRLQVKGVAAHAGVDFERGHSAVVELARLLVQVAAFTDPQRGITVNPGVVGGGTRSNVVAAEAFAEVDVRIAVAADAERLHARFHALRCQDAGCTLTVTGGLNRPPMERSAGTQELFAQAHTLAAGFGLALREAATGGGSDGNFTAALGIPTLDGMGAVGEGAHAAHESILCDSLVERTALLAAMIATV